MHELGHNFNSGHTHDGGYSPRVDTCGCPYSNGRCTESCPAQLPLAKSATIMSYCHLCGGGYANIDYTFGGKYSGTGSRGSIYSYSNSPLAGAVSAEPRQVNAKMWNHVSTRGTCTQPYNQVRNMLNTIMLIYVCNACVHPLRLTIAFLRIAKANNHHQSNESTNDDYADANIKADATADYAEADNHSHATTDYAEADIRANATTNGESSDIYSNATTRAFYVCANI